jgi:hypothetical protein
MGVQATTIYSLATSQAMARTTIIDDVVKRLQAIYSDQTSPDLIRWISSLALVKLCAETLEQIEEATCPLIGNNQS